MHPRPALKSIAIRTAPKMPRGSPAMKSTLAAKEGVTLAGDFSKESMFEDRDRRSGSRVGENSIGIWVFAVRGCTVRIKDIHRGTPLYRLSADSLQ